ncbi:hypothetical protein NL676_020054 [Syzygium grande]|nr:hypothetical protein NL676_020054 [Syzygium grande]
MQYLPFSALLLALLSLPKFSFCQDCSNRGQDSTTIVVDWLGQGQFTTVQKAVNSIPAPNSVWTRILVRPGFYKEKVTIPLNKPCIVLEGNTERDTIIEWSSAGEVDQSATFTLYADNFKAKNIGFKNTYNELTRRGDLNSIKPAPAFQVTTDKVSFYSCAFISVQDTLTDYQGRHYFNSCYIEGAVDFIWGGGQSIYQDCRINASTAILGGLAGYITAQGRNGLKDPSGYIFDRCYVVGTGPVYLGRAYRPHARVVFHKTGGTITFVENQCIGPGADLSQRIKWEKTLSSKELQQLITVDTFINQDGWLEKQPF